MINMKIIKKILKQIIFAFASIYAFNLLGVGLNITIPLNLITIVVVSFLGISGLLSLIGLYLFIL